MGFGITGNYTYSDARSRQRRSAAGQLEGHVQPVAATSRTSASARGSSYTYRSDFFVTFDRSTQLNQEALSSVDASVVVNVLGQRRGDVRRAST